LEYLDINVTIDNKLNIVASSSGLQVTDYPASSTPLQVTSRFQIDQAKMRFVNQRLQSEEEDEIANITDNWKLNIGKLLYQSLFTERVKTLYDNTYEDAKKNGKGIRLRITIENPEIANYPWEIICDSNGNYISTQENFSITRLIPGTPVDGKELKGPLKMLIIGSNPSIPDVAAVQVDHEVSTIMKSLDSEIKAGVIEVERLNGNIEEIMDKLQKEKFNIIHYIGHGGFKGNTGYLALENPDGDLVEADHEKVKNMLGNQTRTCGLIVLNACQGAMSSTSKAFTGLAPTLLNRGFPCILAMRYSISNSMAKFFSKEFYKNLTSMSIDENLQKIREKMLILPNSEPKDFLSPVLFMNSKEGIIFSGPNQFVIEPAWANPFLTGYYDVISYAGIMNHLMESLIIHFGANNYDAIRLQFLAQQPKAGIIQDKIKALKEFERLSTNVILKERISKLETMASTFSNIYTNEDINPVDLTKKAMNIQNSHNILQRELKDLYKDIVNGCIAI
jgi:hypothetical protein